MMYIDILLYFEVLLTELDVDWPLTEYSNILILKLDHLNLPCGYLSFRLECGNSINLDLVMLGGISLGWVRLGFVG